MAPTQEQGAWTARRTATAALVIACLVLLVQATVLMRTRWVEDESWLANGAWTLLQEGTLRMPIFPAVSNVVVDVYPPVQRLAMVPVFAAFGLGEIQARSVSALAAVATVVVVFVVALRIAGPTAAWVASLLLATDSFLVLSARTARPEGLATLLCWVAVLMALAAERNRSSKWALGSGVAAGLSVLTHPIGIAFVGGLGLFHLQASRAAARRAAVDPVAPPSAPATLQAIWGDPGEDRPSPRRPRLFWIFAIGVAIALMPYLAWCFSDAAHIASFRTAWIDRGREPFMDRIIGERDRWADFMGFGSQRVALPRHIPFRIHIVVALFAAFVTLARVRPKLAAWLATLLLINAGCWLVLVGKGPRYMTVVAPLFAILFGAVVSSTSGRKRLLWSVIVGVVLLTQAAGNAYWIYVYRGADYPLVARQLQAAIPPAASVYGITTFWLALHDREYYAYDRTPFEVARDRLKPEFVILNDRVMVHGSGHGVDDFRDLRTQLQDLARRRGVLVARVSNAFYGDLEIYRVLW